MAGVPNIFKQVGDSLKQKEKELAKMLKKPGAGTGIAKSAGAAKPGTLGQAESVNTATPGATPGTFDNPKPFDFQIYIEACKTAFPKFFKEQVPYFFKNFKPVMQKAVPWYKGLPKDEKIAYGTWAGGHVLMLVGIILMIVL